MTSTQQRITTQAVLFQDGPSQLQAHQKAALVKLDDTTRDRYGFTGGPVFLTREAAASPRIEQALQWFTDSPESFETGMTAQPAPGLECLFGFNPDAPNRDAFFVLIWAN